MINVQQVNIQDWHAIMEKVEPNKDAPSDKVLCVVRKDGERFYEVLDKDRWEEISEDPLQKSSYSKLRLKDIMDVSNHLIGEKSQSMISINPFYVFVMPIAAWEKTYHMPLVFSRVPNIVNALSLVSFSEFLKDKNGAIASKEIVDKLQEIEEESQQLRDIFTHLKIMSEKADKKRDASVQTIWERCIYWLSTTLFGDQTSNIKKKLQVELGEKGQVLDIASTILQAIVYQFVNGVLQSQGKQDLTVDEAVDLFSDGNAARIWAYGNGLGDSPLTRIARIWNDIAKAKSDMDGDAIVGDMDELDGLD